MKLALAVVLLTIILSGCTQTPPTGQAVLSMPDQVEEIQQPEIIEEPLVSIEPTPEIDPLDLEPVEPPYISQDKCLYTWELSVSEREYKECYNENYILKINDSTTVEFCNQIDDTYFLSQCYRHLAFRNRDPSICENGEYLFIVFGGAVKSTEISVSDNCYYEYELFHGPTMQDDERDQLCENIDDEQTKSLCFKNIIRGKRNE